MPLALEPTPLARMEGEAKLARSPRRGLPHYAVKRLRGSLSSRGRDPLAERPGPASAVENMEKVFRVCGTRIPTNRFRIYKPWRSLGGLR
jgi:hypothetical protein